MLKYKIEEYNIIVISRKDFPGDRSLLSWCEKSPGLGLPPPKPTCKPLHGQCKDYVGGIYEFVDVQCLEYIPSTSRQHRIELHVGPFNSIEDFWGLLPTSAVCKSYSYTCLVKENDVRKMSTEN